MKVIIKYTLLFVFLFANHHLFATKYTWTGSTSSNWSVSSNWSPNGIPSTTDTIKIVSTTNGPILQGNTTVKELEYTSGTLNLNTYNLTISNNSYFYAGTISNGNVIVRGTYSLFGGTTFSCTIDAIVGRTVFSGGTFNNSASFEQTSNATSNGAGGCIFNAAVTIKKSGNSYLNLGLTNADVFNGTTKIINTSTYAIQLGYNTIAYFNDSLILESSGSGGINFASGNASGGATLSSGEVIVIGSGGFSNGTLVLKNFIQNGSTSQSLTTTGSAIVSLVSSVFNGALTISSPGILLKASTFNGIIDFTKSSTSSNQSYGGNIFNSVATFRNSTTNTASFRLALQEGDIYNGDVSFLTTTGYLQPAFTGTSEFKGNVNISSSLVVFNSGSGKILCTGPNNQSLITNGAFNYVVSKLGINKSGGTVTLNAPLIVDSLLELTQGNIITSNSYLLTLKAPAIVIGGSLNSFVSGPVKKIGNTSFKFPVGKGVDFRPVTISAPSIITDAFMVEYYNSAQTNGTTKDTSVNYISDCNYWKIERNTGTSNVNLTFNWFNKQCDVFDIDSTKLLKWDGIKWKDLGLMGYIGNDSLGSTSMNGINEYGYFAFGHKLFPIPSFTYSVDTTTFPVKVMFQNTSRGFSNSANNLWFFDGQNIKGYLTSITDTLSALLDTINSKMPFIHYYYASLDYIPKLSIINNGLIYQYLDTIKLKKQAPQINTCNVGNIVKNPGMDNQSPNCPSVPWNISNSNGTSPFLNSWYSPTLGSPDFLLTDNTCQPGLQIGYPLPIGTCQSPCWGNPSSVGGCGTNINSEAAIAIITVSNSPGTPLHNYHEYIQEQLNQTLIAGGTYRVSFNTILGDASHFGSEIQASLTVGPRTNFNIGTTLLGMPITVNSGVVTDKNNWTSVTGLYVASGNEDHITIGNFRNVANSPTISTPLSNNTCTNWLIATPSTASYYWVDDVSVELVPVALSLTKTDVQNCSSNLGTANATATAGVPPYSYSWSNGASSNSISNLLAGVYTCTVVDAVGCIATSSVTIIGAPNAPKPIINGDIYECSANNVYSVINATIGASYNFNISFTNGATGISGAGSSAIVDPINTPACIDGFTITFIVNQGQSCELSTSYIVYKCCEGTVNKNTGPNTNFPTLTLNNVNIASLGNYITTTNQELSSYLSLYPIPGTLQSYFYLDGQLKSSETIAINGDFIVDHNLAISNSDILMGPNARIILMPGVFLYFLDRVYMHSCGEYMWDGIYANSVSGVPSRVVSTNKLVVEDALNAIVISGNNEANLVGTYFNKNAVSILFNNSIDNNSNIAGCSFHCLDNFVTNIPNFNINPSPTNGVLTILPFNSTSNIRGTGVVVNEILNQSKNFGLQIGEDYYLDPIQPLSQPIQCGSSGCSANKFFNLDYGIDATNSSLRVVNNEFEKIDNLTSNVTPLVNGSSIGTAIRVNGNSQQTPSEIEIGGSNNTVWNLNTLKNTFTDCKHGILTNRRVIININNNIFNNIYSSAVWNQYGIRDNYESNISQNRFNNCNRGIRILNLVGSSSVFEQHSFNNNFYNFTSLTVPLAPTNYRNTQRFLSIENVSTPYLTEFEANNNVVNGAHIGFYLSNVSGNALTSATIFNNTVNLQGYTQNPVYNEYGALLRNSKNITLEQNQITGTTSGNLVQRGISVETSSGYLEFKSNNVLSLGTGIRIYNNSPDLGFFCNLMDNDFRGIQNEASNVGQQGDATNTSDNQWSNNIDYDEYAVGNFLSSLWYLRNSPSNYAPSLLPNVLNQFINKQLVTNNVTPNCSNPCPPPNGCRTDYFNYKISQIDTATILTNEQKYNSQATIYAQLELEMPDSLLLTDAVVVQFKDSMDNSNAKKISQIHQKIIDNEFVEATTINSALSPQNNSEWNFKIFNEIYLSTWANDNFDLSDYQIRILNDIAQQNPLYGGIAVYYARVMLDLQLDDELDEAGSSRIGLSNIDLKSFNNPSKLICSIIENPTSNLIQIKCNSLIQNCEQAILLNSRGQIVNKWNKPEVNQDQISLKINNLATGLYQVVLIKDTQTYTGKVVIHNK